MAHYSIVRNFRILTKEKYTSSKQERENVEMVVRARSEQKCSAVHHSVHNRFQYCSRVTQYERRRSLSEQAESTPLEGPLCSHVNTYSRVVTQGTTSHRCKTQSIPEIPAQVCDAIQSTKLSQKDFVTGTDNRRLITS
jgi:hypothetical protein